MPAPEWRSLLSIVDGSINRVPMCDLDQEVRKVWMADNLGGTLLDPKKRSEYSSVTTMSGDFYDEQEIQAEAPSGSSPAPTPDPDPDLAHAIVPTDALGANTPGHRLPTGVLHPEAGHQQHGPPRRRGVGAREHWQYTWEAGPDQHPCQMAKPVRRRG